MKIISKIKYPNGKREVKLFGKKIFTYVNWKQYNLGYGIKEYNDMPAVHSLEKDIAKYPKISIVYPVYYTHDNFEDLNSLLNRYDNCSSEIKKDFEIIIVDDCSPSPITLPKMDLNITLLRIEKDIPWNQSGARNLGACYAISPKLILMDAEWFVPEKTIKALINGKLTNNDIVPLRWAKDENTIPQRTHPNIFCINKQAFFNYNCYDESWCGFYGEDLFFRRYLHALGINIIITDYPIIPNAKNFITNDSHNLSRNLNKAKKKLAKNENLTHKKKLINFPYKFICQYKFEQGNI